MIINVLYYFIMCLGNSMRSSNWLPITWIPRSKAPWEFQRIKGWQWKQLGPWVSTHLRFSLFSPKIYRILMDFLSPKIQNIPESTIRLIRIPQDWDRRNTKIMKGVHSVHSPNLGPAQLQDFHMLTPLIFLHLWNWHFVIFLRFPPTKKIEDGLNLNDVEEQKTRGDQHFDEAFHRASLWGGGQCPSRTGNFRIQVRLSPKLTQTVPWVGGLEDNFFLYFHGFFSECSILM